MKKLNLILNELSRKELMRITAGDTIIIDDIRSGGGTNNGGGSGNVINPCLVHISKCLTYNKCKDLYITNCE